MLSTLTNTNFYFSSAIILSFANAFNLDWQKILSDVNPLPNDKIVYQSKFKAFADGKIIATQKFKFVSGRVENIVGKGENAGYQHFLLFSQCFKRPLKGLVKVRIVW